MRAQPETYVSPIQYVKQVVDQLYNYYGCWDCKYKLSNQNSSHGIHSMYLQSTETYRNIEKQTEIHRNINRQNNIETDRHSQKQTKPVRNRQASRRAGRLA